MNELEWMQDAALGLRAEIEAEGVGRRDLADVLARARAIDADAVPPGLTALGDDGDEAELADAELAVFADALRHEVEGDVEDRAMHPATPPVEEAPARRRAWAILGVLAAAVVAVVAVDALRPDVAQLDAEATPGSMASKTVDALAEDDAWTKAAEESKRPEVAPKPRSGPRPEAVPEAAPTLEIEAEPESRPAPRAKRRPTLDELERDAMAAWKAGELARAESLLRVIIGRAGRGTKAELAYGDLFSLAKQRGGATQQTKVWRQYLEKFPNGRHADDARAGLCMRASGEAASKCWAKYLDKHPRGAHASRARRAVE